MKRRTTALNMVTMFVVILLLTPSAAVLAEGGSIDCYPASIGDTVWYDLDGGGTQNNGEKGIPGVTVFLYLGTCGGTPLASDVTDQFGAYLFAGLDPDQDYCVAVDESTLPAPAFANTTSNEYSDYLSDGEANTLADFGYRATVCLPAIDFETDSQGNPLAAGTRLGNYHYQPWEAWGVTLSTGDPQDHPIMVFNSTVPTGGDPDLGTPNQDFGGLGVGNGGKAGTVGENNKGLGKVMILSSDNNAGNPNDWAHFGGKITFNFTQDLDTVLVEVLDIEESSGGTIKTFNSSGGLIRSTTMGGLGNNSYQALDVAATGVRKLEITMPGSGAIPSLVFCDYGYDYGDLPDGPYPTLNASDGAHHLLLPGGPILGSTVDAETDGQPDGTANGDDGNPPFPGPDDEDGVLPTGARLVSTQPFTLSITVDSVGADGAFLDVWFDWNADGDLDSVEHTRIAVTAADNGIPFDYGFVPINLVSGSNIFARFRLSSHGITTANGVAADGEVEDYLYQSAPLFAPMGPVKATAFVDAVRVEWESSGEFNTIGYNVERALSPDGPWTQLNGDLIRSKTDSLDGAFYDFVDTEVEQGIVDYYYRIVSLDNSATPTYSEVIKVTVPVIGEPYEPYVPPTPASIHRVFLPMIGK